jgi:hypothetical protein
MLRSLQLYRTDANGQLILDDDGNPVRVSGDNYRPKRREEMSADELHYVDVTAKATDENHRIAMAKSLLEREAMLSAADAVLAREAQKRDEALTAADAVLAREARRS